MNTYTVEITEYAFDDLSETAKDKARDNWRIRGLDYEWYDSTHDDAKTIGELMGITIDHIFFSGFSSQGDGACFEGSYEYVKGSAKAVKEWAPLDTDLHAIAERLQYIQAGYFYGLCANIKQSGHYMHEMCTDITIDASLDYIYPSADTEEELKDALRDYMRWIYRRLENEYDWLMNDEQVDETIRANDYRFTEFGEFI